MIFVLYYHEKSKSSDNKNDCHIHRAEVTKLIEPINQYMIFHALKNKIVNDMIKIKIKIVNDMIKINIIIKLIIIAIQAYPCSQILLGNLQQVRMLLANQ